MALMLQVAFDTKDPKALSDFYAQVLGYKKDDPPKGFATWEEALKAYGVPENEWNSRSAIIDPEGKGPRIYFQQMDTPKPGKNRVHLDVNVSKGSKVSLEERKAQVRAEVQRLEKIGARVQKEWDEKVEFWIVMLDPEGNEFCIQ
jgi:catechol 2,3-dioxygenase-like lactoylglutathione lyase family enzyme